MHRVGVLPAELEDVADFDAAMAFQRRAAADARIAFDRGREVAVLGLRKIAARCGVVEMHVFLVAADDPSRAALERMIGEHARALRADRSAISDRTAGRLFE